MENKNSRNLSLYTLFHLTLLSFYYKCYTEIEINFMIVLLESVSCCQLPGFFSTLLLFHLLSLKVYNVLVQFLKLPTLPVTTLFSWSDLISYMGIRKFSMSYGVKLVWRLSRLLNSCHYVRILTLGTFLFVSSW